jgi:transcriptional regulator with XRE-family HTH domain
MSNSAPINVFPGFADVPGLDEARRRRRPYADLAMSIARLRSTLGLTQAEFATRVGTTQSVVSRLESGRHGIQISLLDRIAAAVGTSWRVAFGDAEGVTPERPVEIDDPLLAAFNEANTVADLDAAHRHAVRISKAANTPRRQLALALDAFNQRRYDHALRWSTRAQGGELPTASREVSHLVAGRALLGLRRPAEADVMLAGAGDNPNARAARVEVLIEQDRIAEAVEASGNLLESDDPTFRAAAEFLAARVAWHDERPLDALVHVGAFRGLRPTDREGLLLQGAILGHLGDTNGDRSAYETAMGLFDSAFDGTDAETVRLFGLTAARLGRADQALEAARRLRDLPADPGRDHAGDVEAIVTGLLDRLEDAALGSAIDAAAADELVELAVVRSYRAQAAASRGEFEQAVEALGLDPAEIAQASPTDQVRCATAYLVGARFADAYPLLHRNVEALSVPDGQLFLARAALAQRGTRPRHGDRNQPARRPRPHSVRPTGSSALARR